MGESAALRAKDYRALHQLIGDCRDLGADPIAWRLHLLERLCDFLHARVGIGGEVLGIDRGQFTPLSIVEYGWNSDAERRAMFEWLEHQASTGHRTGLLPTKLAPTDRGLTVARADLVDNRAWHNSPQYAEYLRRSQLDDLVVSFQRIKSAMGQFCCITLFRAPGEPHFGRRDTNFLRTLHRELAPMIGRQLAAANEPSALQLSPQRRQVLGCLLEGDGEKQVAARLGLTRQTVHQYVKAIYRHFRVSSRAELMARWIRHGRCRYQPQHPLQAPPSACFTHR